MRTLSFLVTIAGIAATTSSTPSSSSPSLTTQGIPVGTANGVEDSQIACAQGDASACNLPNIPWIGNPNPGENYQSQAGDVALGNLYSTGRYNALGQRVQTSTSPFVNYGTTDIPYYTSGLPVNTGGVITTANNNFYQTPLAQQTTYVSSSPAANPSLLPSASNQYLPTSPLYLSSNLNPSSVTAPNQASAGYSYPLTLGSPASTATLSSQTSPLSSAASFYPYGNSFTSASSFAPSYFGSSFQSPFSSTYSSPYSAPYSYSTPYSSPYSYSAPYTYSAPYSAPYSYSSAAYPSASSYSNLAQPFIGTANSPNYLGSL